MKKRFFAAILSTLALVGVITPQLDVQAIALIADVEPAIAEQGYFFQDYDIVGRLNIDRNDAVWGDEQRMLYLTDVVTGERITEVQVGEEYDLHCLIINDGHPAEPLENVRVMIGQGDEYNSVNLNAVISFGYQEDDTHGCVEFFSNYPVINRVDDIPADGWARLQPVGKAKLYNHGGYLNGAQVNHKQLFMDSSSMGILVGYDDQNGYLPYGKEYACEIRVRVRLEVEDGNCFWSDPCYEGRYTGRMIENF